LTITQKAFELLVASESTSYSAVRQQHNHQHELYLFEFVISGKGYAEIGIPQEKFRCTADSYFMIPPDIPNQYWSDPGTVQEKIFFICRGTLVKSLLEVYGMEKSYIVRNAHLLLKYFQSMLILAKQYGARKDSEAAIVFHEFIQAAHYNVYKDEGTDLPSSVEKLCRILDEHLEKKVDFVEVSHKVAYSRAYIVRLFKRHMGITPHEYVLKRRLDRSKLLLRHSTLSIKEIAGRLMFSDQYHFSNYFKKCTGISPSEYRTPKSQL
jgi:AraC-like DNA-binding protein